MTSIQVGMSFSNYDNEYSYYNKYSEVDENNKEHFYKRTLKLDKFGAKKEINLFNTKNLNWSDMSFDNETVSFEVFENKAQMKKDGFTYSTSNQTFDGDPRKLPFTRIDANDCYAIDLNHNGKVDKNEIFIKNNNKKLPPSEKMPGKQENEIKNISDVIGPYMPEKTNVKKPWEVFY